MFQNLLNIQRCEYCIMHWFDDPVDLLVADTDECLSRGTSLHAASIITVSYHQDR